MAEGTISRRDFLKVAAAGTAVLVGGAACIPVVEKMATVLTPTPGSTETKMPDHLPLSIVEQTINEPVTIPSGGWNTEFVCRNLDVSTVEDGYRLINKTQVFNGNSEGVIIDSPSRGVVMIFTNGLAFDRRGNINGLPVPWAEDRCVMGSPDKIKTLIDAQNLERNKHVIMVEAQTYAVQGGANWELAAFGPGIQPQRFLQTMNDPVMKPIAP